MTVAQLVERGMAVQPLDELSAMVVEGIRDGRFLMILDPARSIATLTDRLDKVSRGVNPTELHHFG